MKLTLISVKNYKGVKLVVISPGDHNVIYIAGLNKVGKSSLIGAMTAALGGGKEAPEEPVRRGTKKAEIDLVFDGPENLEVRRCFTSKGGTSLEVRDKDGKKSSPQKILDKLVGARFLSPLRFIRLPEKQQREMLLGCVDLGLDLEVHAKQRKAAFDNRTDANRDVKRLKGELEVSPDPGKLPEEISTNELLAELETLTEKDSARLAAVHKLSSMIGDAKNKKAAIENAKEDIKKAHDYQSDAANRRKDALARLLLRNQAELDLLEKRHAKDAEENDANVKQANISFEGRKKDYADFIEDGKVARAEAEGLSKLDLTNDIEAAKAAIKEASSKNQERVLLVEQKKKHDIATEKLEDAEREASNFDTELEELDQEKASALASANMPIEGLDVDEARVLYNGIPLSQASGAEELQVSLAIAAALSPELQDIWLEEGSLLDQNSLKLIHDYAVENDLRIWLERVGESDDDCIIIEDGMVRT